MAKIGKTTKETTANLGFEAELGNTSICGQEGIATTLRLAIMNLAIRGIQADIGKEHADTFSHIQHPDLRADYVLANPPFDKSDWFRLERRGLCGFS